MRAALHRAAKKENHRRGAAARASAHASRWADDELAEHAPRPPRLRAERRAWQRPLSGRSRVGQACHYGYDAHGNITFLTDAAGTVTDSYDYDAFGNIAAMTGSTTNWRLFGGEEIDPDLGLINLRARQYRPTTGRFLTIDPVVGAPASPISFNRYLYASADPVNLTDPLGLATAAEWGNLVSGVSGSLIRQVVFTAGKGAVIGGSAAVLGHAVACTMLNETSVFTALVSTEDEQEPLLRLSSVLGCGRYTCYCRCHIEGRDRYPGTGIPPMVTGKGRGVDVAAAKVNCEKAAKRNFGDAPWNPGDSRVYTRHCQVSHFQCYKDG